MQGNAGRGSFAVLAAIVMLSLAEAGCVELKYSAQNRLADPVAIRSSRPIRSVYFSFSAGRPRDTGYAEYFTGAFTAALREKGFVVAETASGADIVMNAKTVFYRKAQGTFLFVLLLPTYRFNEDYDGIGMTITYKADKGRSHKRYRAYYRGWLSGDQEIASEHIIDAIIKDISPSGK